MKTLCIIRHAKSDWNDPSLNDFERPLNKRGEKNAPFMGKLLASKQLRPDLILSSPAVRARTTALMIAGEVGYDTDAIVYDEELYLAERNDIERILQKIPPSYNTVFIVGHNPGLTLFVHYLSGYSIDNIPTCGVVTVSLNE
ncbi:MAG: histidine phosphatase family protein, partial [Campylobacterales bacterium]|nr:histidine phosphatase family protein [Campylobacterales bacterium]